MSLTIQTKKVSDCGKYKFNIFHHELSMEDLDKYILKIMFDEQKLHNLFEPHTLFESKKRINQLRRFIEPEFKNLEDKITDIDVQKKIDDNTNSSYYSFFAEALLARLNIDYIDDKLITGVISITDTIKTVSTGADVCMYSNENLVIGEAKFYGKLDGGLNSILEDSSFLSKLEYYCNNVIESDVEIIIKNIIGDVRKKTIEEIKKIPFLFSGFVLHSKTVRDNYDTHYEKLNTLKIENMPDHFIIHLYHLPISSKEDFILKTQRHALNLIIDLNIEKE